MSNHFTGLSLGPPLGDQRLDLCDLYAFQSPERQEQNRDHPQCKSQCGRIASDAIYRVNIDTDGDYLTDVAFSYVFSKPQNGRQTFSVFMAKGAELRSAEAAGAKIVSDAEVSFGTKPNIVSSGPYTFFAGSRSDAFFFDFDGSRTCSTPAANGTLPNPISAASRHGPAWIRIRKPTYSRPRSSCRRANLIPSPRSDLGAMQPATRRQAASRRSRGPSERQQLLQHRRYQGGIQRQRAGQRPQPVDGAVHSPDGAYRQLHARGSYRRDRQEGTFPTC